MSDSGCVVTLCAEQVFLRYSCGVMDCGRSRNIICSCEACLVNTARGMFGVQGPLRNRVQLQLALQPHWSLEVKLHMRAHCRLPPDHILQFDTDNYMYAVVICAAVTADYDSPWDQPKPKPQPSLLTAADSNCTGAAASSPACMAMVQRSAVSPAVLSRLATLLWVLWVVWLLR